MRTPSTTTYSRGDIVLVSFPFTDLTSTKQRPALVISPDTFNFLNGDLILAAITSQLNPFPHSIRLLPEDCIDGTLPKASMAKLTKIFTLSGALVRKRLCRLSEEKLKNVLVELRDLYS